jgi:phospholipase/carboxylesterase
MKNKSNSKVPKTRQIKFNSQHFDCEWIPASRSIPRAQQKVMIVLHGRGDSLKSFRSIKRELRRPDINYLLLNAPRRYLTGFSWYALEPNHERGVKEARARLFSLVGELKERGWESQEIIWMGHSQGCLVACDMVFNHPDQFAGLVGVSGYMWFFRGWRSRVRQSGATKTPWLITHGSRDQIIKPSEIRADIVALASEVPVLYREFKKGHNFDYEEEVPFIRDWLKNTPNVNVN